VKVTEEMIDAADKALEAYMSQSESPPMGCVEDFERWHRAGYRVSLEAAIAAAHPNANRIEIELGAGMLDVATVTAFAAVLSERFRQVHDLGYDPRHDDCRGRGELASLAARYALNAVDDMSTPDPLRLRVDPRRTLVKAGALILAELERLDRAAALCKAAEDARGATGEQRFRAEYENGF
jgi:hypothetical protein